MILIGQYDSPFVRRVGIALTLYGMAFEHRPWSTFAEGDKIEPYNPLRRVPTLVLDDGEALIETLAILDHLDEIVGPAAALIADRGLQRRRELGVCVLAGGLADKAVSLFYERVLHDQTSSVWEARCRGQVGAALGALEARAADLATPYWHGAGVGHADVAVTTALRFISEAHARHVDLRPYPRLLAHAAACEATPAFGAISQPFIPPP